MALRGSAVGWENEKRGLGMGTGITGPTRLWYLTATVGLLR